MSETTAQRLDRLTNRGAVLAGSPLAPPPSPVHEAAVLVFTRLIEFGVSASDQGSAPLPMRALMRTLEKSKPMLIEGLAKMPPENIQTFMAGLIAELQQIVDAPVARDPA